MKNCNKICFKKSLPEKIEFSHTHKKNFGRDAFVIRSDCSCRYPESPGQATSHHKKIVSII